MRDKDVVYIANARSNRLARLIVIINQFVSLIMAEKILAQ
jgi:hypothetical protein